MGMINTGFLIEMTFEEGKKYVEDNGENWQNTKFMEKSPKALLESS